MSLELVHDPERLFVVVKNSARCWEVRVAAVTLCRSRTRTEAERVACQLARVLLGPYRSAAEIRSAAKEER